MQKHGICIRYPAVKVQGHSLELRHASPKKLVSVVDSFKFKTRSVVLYSQNFGFEDYGLISVIHIVSVMEVIYTVFTVRMPHHMYVFHDHESAGES